MPLRATPASLTRSAGEGNFDDGSKGGAGGAGGAAPAAAAEATPKGRRKGTSKKAKTAREKLAIIDGTA